MAVVKSRLLMLSKEEVRERNNAASRAYRERNREKHRTIQRASAKRIREQAYSNLGGACAWCGISYQPVLEIDHINSDRSSEPHKKSHLYRASRGEVRGLQLLCGNCHNEKTKGAATPEWREYL